MSGHHDESCDHHDHPADEHGTDDQPGHDHDHHDGEHVEPFAEDPGHTYYYRRGELLVWTPHSERLQRVLADEQPDVRLEADRESGNYVIMHVTAETDIPTIVSRLLDAPREEPLRVAPHHVVTTRAHVRGKPAHAPVPAPPRNETFGPVDSSAAVVAVLDTGVQATHPALQKSCVALKAPNPSGLDDADPADVARPAAVIAEQAGHGTFVAGIVLQEARTAQVVFGAVIDPTGVGDDESLAKGIRRCADHKGRLDIINISAGGTAHPGTDLVLTWDALQHLWQKHPDVAVVAAAGNEASSEPLYPAAFPGVIAVGALDEAEENPAWFTNHGPWVRACTCGVLLNSTFPDYGGLQPADGTVPPGTGPFSSMWAYWSGTSFACARVSGILARKMSAQGTTAAKAFRSVTRTGTPLAFAEPHQAIQLGVKM